MNVASGAPSVEQVGLQFIIDNAHEQFAKTVLSTKTKVLLIGGYVDEGTALKAYLLRHRPEIDRRRRLSDEDAKYLELAEEYAWSAQEYIEWVRADAGQPIYREALVSYTTAFENCLKSIAVAFFLAEDRADAALTAEVKIPSAELSNARRRVADNWKKAEGDQPRIRMFFESNIADMKAARHFPIIEGSPDMDWDLCSAAFRVRNALVHNLGFMPQTETLGSLELHAGWSVELDQPAIAKVAEAFSKVLYPFGPDRWFLTL